MGGVRGLGSVLVRMKTYVRYTRTFVAGHQLSDDPTGLCGTLEHGHDWTIEIEAEQGPFPDNGGFDYPEALDGLIHEINRRSLNLMLKGANPTPAGVAAWFLERLRLHVPGLRTVTVGFSGHSVRCEV